MNKIWVGTFFLVLLWSAINPKDYPTWILEAAPALIGFIVLAATRQGFPLTGLAYFLILAHSIVLMVGAHYTYAEVPLFNWLKEVFDLGRNNYDKVGHFAQGFVPAIVSREILIRNQVLNHIKWLNFFIICIGMAISAFYELIEWAVALLNKEAAEAFLGTQGYVWDTQSDMAYALLGIILAIVLLSEFHNRQLSKLAAKSG
jgi:putative membrane protein